MSTLNFWNDKTWHPIVHERLGETLYFFLVRIRPFSMAEVTTLLEDLISQNKLGSIQVFPIFGSYDLLIKIWLHPTLVNKFRQSLDSILLGTKSIHPFVVEHIDRRWQQAHQISDLEVLSSLDEQSIRAVQAGQEVKLLANLMDLGFVLVKNQPDAGIRFFMAINFEALSETVLADSVGQIRHYLGSHNDILHASIYRGFGFCSILLAGEVKEYLSIGKLTEWIREKFKFQGVVVETYLVANANDTMENGTLAEATFLALRGTDLFVQSILPEIYETNSPKAQEVQRFLTAEVPSRVLTRQDKKLLHDYLLGYLESDPSAMAKTLFIFFFDIESYLRNNYKKYLVQETGKQLSDLYATAHLDMDRQHRPTLGDMLNLYSLVQDSKNGAWQEVVVLRNQLVHGDMDFLKDWSTPLKRLLAFLPEIRQMISQISNITGNPYSGVY